MGQPVVHFEILGEDGVRTVSGFMKPSRESGGGRLVAGTARGRGTPIGTAPRQNPRYPCGTYL